jgi:hypothetical protein
VPGHGWVGGIGRHRGEGFAEFCAQFFQRGAIAGDPDDLRARLAQGGGDATAEAPAGAGDHGRRACYFIVRHNDPSGSGGVPSGAGERAVRAVFRDGFCERR